MAQTITDIEADIDAQIAADPVLSAALVSTSNVAIFKLWRSCIATILNLFQRQQDDYQATVQAIVDNRELYTDPWWQEQMLAFQFGDLLLFINNKYQYAAIDPTKQVINLCAVTGVGGQAVLKCASLVGGVPQQLTTDQIAGAQSYAEEMRACGIEPVVQSFPPDLLKLYLNIYYNPQGDLATIKTQVELAINTYLISLSTTNFNGILYLNKLIDAIQAIPAVINDQVVIVQVAVKPTEGAYSDIVSHYPSVSGYFAIDPDFLLSATLNYIAG